jgi:hypothetical protein
LNQELEEKLFNYVTTLEGCNEELLKTLKYSVAAIKETKAHVPNQNRYILQVHKITKYPERWSGRLDLNQRPQRPERCALPD